MADAKKRYSVSGQVAAASRAFKARRRCPFCGEGGPCTVCMLGNFRMNCMFCGALGPPADTVDGANKAWGKRCKHPAEKPGKETT